MVGELAGDQWNEGDVSCSVVRRVALPDAFFAADGLFQTFLTVLDEFGAFPAVIQRELDRYLPFLATTKVLMAAVRNGVGRETAHEAIKEAAVGVALAMRQGQAENDVFARLAADRGSASPRSSSAHSSRSRSPSPVPPSRRPRRSVGGWPRSSRGTQRPRRTPRARSSSHATAGSSIEAGAEAGHDPTCGAADAGAAIRAEKGSARADRVQRRSWGSRAARRGRNLLRHRARGRDRRLRRLESASHALRQRRRPDVTPTCSTPPRTPPGSGRSPRRF